ncbi:MAG: SDR family oxidoreductase [Pleurocapsa sp. MO_192.B19]|nr:SDR family oxidoreductase [Pleurocapsa sp. MO_192.B19]
MKTIALITGSNKGMGFESARQLAKQDIHVLIGARNSEKGKAAVKSLQDEGLSAEFLLLDVINEESVKNSAQAVANQHGKLDILVNNAGINPEYRQGIFTFEQLPFDLLIQIYETNVFGAFLAIREFLPLLRKSTAGRIVNVSSSVGSLTEQSNRESLYYGINTVGYNSSKTALNAMTVQLAKQLSGTTIKVNSICPGWVKTDIGSDAAPRTVDEGVRIIVQLATLAEDGASGGFFNEDGMIPW